MSTKSVDLDRETSSFRRGRLKLLLQISLGLFSMMSIFFIWLPIAFGNGIFSTSSTQSLQPNNRDLVRQNIERMRQQAEQTLDQLTSQDGLGLDTYFRGMENGVGGRGGGQGVVVNGRLRFLDLLTEAERRSAQTVTSATLQRLARGLSLQCRDELLREQVAPMTSLYGVDIEVSLAPAFGRAEDVITRVIAPWSPGYASALTGALRLLKERMIVVSYYPINLLTPWRDSAAIPQSAQWPIAFFNHSVLIINEPLFKALTPKDQAGLLLHELFRQITLTPGDRSQPQSLLENIAMVERVVFLLMNEVRSEELKRLLMIDEYDGLDQKADELVKSFAPFATALNLNANLAPHDIAQFGVALNALVESLKTRDRNLLTLSLWTGNEHQLRAWTRLVETTRAAATHLSRKESRGEFVTPAEELNSLWSHSLHDYYIIHVRGSYSRRIYRQHAVGRTFNCQTLENLIRRD